ncbi:MAG: DUF58 domain-containing protein [Dehalococcoidales bacterium]|nr:MAG: DUF58 domain-containing protein [Dehalococcoidales bacterium]
MRALSQIYLLALLLVGTILAPFPYSPVAIILLVAMVLLIYQPGYRRLRVIVTLATLFLLPLVVEQLLDVLSTASLSLGFFSVTQAQAIATATVLPAIYLLDWSLLQSVHGPDPKGEQKEGRSITSTTISLFALAFVMILISIVVTSPPLFFTGAVFITYLLVVLVRALLAVPATAFDIPVVEKRVVVGNTTDITASLTNKASIGLLGTFVPVESWFKASPTSFKLNGGRTELLLSAVPPLAGPLRPQLQVSVVDSRGLVRANRVVEPIALHVIPRAKYAEWLALRYLEQARTGGGESAVPELQAPRRGTEYLDSRSYQPGDELRRMDWKHTVKFNQLTVKEFVEAGGQTAIIGVNLSVADAEEADRLAFDLITTTLTLAQEAVPTALAAYNHEQVLLTTAVIDPTETLKHSLSLVNSITLADFGRRLLQPASFTRLRRNMGLLKEATSQPAQQLLNILDFEYRAIEKAARNHPATVALLRSTERVPAPAAIVTVSRLNHDAEAVMVTTEKLLRRGFTTLPLVTT